METLKTFSANSLKILDKDPVEFRLKYEEGLFLTQDPPSAKAGQNLHSFLCYYLKGFNLEKIENALAADDKDFLEKIKTYSAISYLKAAQEKHIEQPFLIKCTPPAPGTGFYLTGRFDAVLNPQGQTVKIYDWKTQNLPKNPECDIQTIVYLYSASKLYKTENVSITYVALARDESIEIPYNPECDYLLKISNIVDKYYI